MKGFLSKPKYADDITYAGTSLKQIDELEEKIPIQLKEYNLTANETKTERYQIPKPPPPTPPKPLMESLMQHKDDKPLWSEVDWLVNYKPKIKDKTPNWRNRKFLGSKLDTLNFQRRRALTINKHERNRLCLQIKNTKDPDENQNLQHLLVICFSYITLSLWTLTATIEKANQLLPEKNAPAST